MFVDEDLINHLETSNTVQVDSLIIAEWNQNVLDNIKDYGNYRYRPSASASIYRNLANSYDENDEGNFFTNALESKSISEYRTSDPNEPLIFLNEEKERELLYSLKDCFNPFRPRSGINKMLFFNGKFIDGVRSGRRPRYYFSSRKDQFKYWTSYREESGVEVGISSVTPRSSNPSFGYEITDAAPFVVYREEVVANRIVVKMQTNMADPDTLGIDGDVLVPQQIRLQNSLVVDPLIDRTKSTIPKKWSIEYLDSSNNWIKAKSFDETSTRSDGSPVVSWDGYVELSYGIKIPEDYRSNFHFIDYISSSVQLPTGPINGEAYIVATNPDTSPGTIYVWNNFSDDWEKFPATYGFSLVEDDDTKRIGIVPGLTYPRYFIQNDSVTFRDFTFIKGLRVVVESMEAPDKTFDLIEMSPRLKADVSGYVISYDVNKKIAETDYGLPVGGITADSGRIVLSNHDGAFTRLNYFNKDTKTGSIVAKNLRPQIKFDIYETILNVNGYDKFVPLKTLYSENSSESFGGFEEVSLNLRDALFRFESATAASLFLQNCTLTMAVATLLDNIGFGNYIFKNITTANDPVIPFFFVEPDISVAQVLQRLAVSTQTAMFFDEYNNFVIMPKEYLLPEYSVLDTDSSISNRLSELRGQKLELENGSYKAPNIETIAGVETKILNDGQINYTTRYVEREVSKLEQAQLDLSERTYGYKASLLWQVGDQEVSRTINQLSGNSGYVLGAVALVDDLTDVVPYVENNQIQGNVIDVGENAIWLPRFQGYLYANGEVIRYDAQEYFISGGVGAVWISNNKEYQKYFSKLPFNGQIYPTGNIKIYAEPFYEELPGAQTQGLEAGVIYKNGAVKSHGRGQFGTSIVQHSAGLSSYWKNSNNKKSFRMHSEYLFKTTPTELIKYPPLDSVDSLAIGEDNTAKGNVAVSDKIVNFMKKTVRSEQNSSTVNQDEVGSVQSSALVLSGTSVAPPSSSNISTTTTRDLVSYVYKELDSDYKHVGTRMRIVGKKTSSTKQIPLNGTTYFTVDDNATTSRGIQGGSGGIGYMVNKNNNSGYYFEIMSLSEDVIKQYSATGSASTQVIENLVFYKVLPRKVRSVYTDEAGQTVTLEGKSGAALPVKLWGTTAKILVDEGKFVGMDRLASQDNPTVYDIGIEHEKVGNSVKFYLYLNNALIATVIDNNPLPSVTDNTSFTTCLFVRGSSKCMFENIYALKNKARQTESVSVISSTDANNNRTSRNILSVTGNNKVSVSDALRKYAMSGLVQSTYLSSISSEKPPGYKIYFEEFGTILRECAYFNVKYDQAYPALKAKFLTPFNNEKTYTVSGFLPGSYGAEFLIFNSTDKAIYLGDSSANAIMIFGVTFTQNISNVLSVDDYFREASNLSDPLVVNNVIKSPDRAQKFYDNIKNSRASYGNKAFSLDSFYVQNEDSAKDLMSWIIGKTIKSRRVIGVNTFAMPHIQLGDIVTIDYELQDGVKFVEDGKRFVVIAIDYSRSSSDIKTSLRLIEV